MPYVEDHLNPGEEIVQTTTLHPFIFVNGGLLAILALLLIGSGPEAVPVGWFLLLVALVVLAGTWVRYTTSEFAVTTSRVVIKTGWLSRATLELQLAKVEAVAVHQGVIGSAVDFGTLIVAGTGGRRAVYVHQGADSYPRIRAAPDRGSIIAHAESAGSERRDYCPTNANAPTAPSVFLPRQFAAASAVSQSRGETHDDRTA